MSDDRLDAIIEFRFGDVFPADDIVSEWLATISLAFNDIAFIHSSLEAAFKGPAHDYLYLLRLSMGHFHEAAMRLDETETISEIKKFVGSLPSDVQEHYTECLALYRRQRSYLGRMRNVSIFHYPDLIIRQRRRVFREVLAGLADETTSLFKPKTETIGGSRLLWADDIASRLFVSGGGDDDEVIAHHEEIRAAITSYMRFANGAINEWLGRAMDRGVSLASKPGRPPSYSDVRLRHP